MFNIFRHAQKWIFTRNDRCWYNRERAQKRVLCHEVSLRPRCYRSLFFYLFLKIRPNRHPPRRQNSSRSIPRHFKVGGYRQKFVGKFSKFPEIYGNFKMPRMIIASSKSTDTICKAKLGEFSRTPLYLLSRIQLCTSCTNALSFFIQFSYLLRIFLLSHLR